MPREPGPYVPFDMVPAAAGTAAGFAAAGTAAGALANAQRVVVDNNTPTVLVQQCHPLMLMLMLKVLMYDPLDHCVTPCV